MKAIVFPGQGTQFVGMSGCFESNSDLLEKIRKSLDADLLKLMSHGPEADLNRTQNVQKAVFTINIALFSLLVLPENVVFAGHSLGEYSAVVAAGALQFDDAMKVVEARSLAMERQQAKSSGAMSVILGLDDARVEEICRGFPDQVFCANYNAPGQVVISGEFRAVEEAVRQVIICGGKARPIPVLVAAHTPCMAEAVVPLASAIGSVPFTDCRYCVFANTTGRPIKGASEVRGELIQQMTSPIHWVDIVRNMAKYGVDEFVEVGPKPVLASLIHRILGADFPVSNICSLADARSFNGR